MTGGAAPRGLLAIFAHPGDETFVRVEPAPAPGGREGALRGVV